jgi:DoxX-like family
MWIAAITLSVLVALVFVANGVAKLLGHPKMTEASTHLGYSVRAFRIIGLLEVFGALGILLAPLYVPVSVAAAIGLVLLTLGGFVAHLRASDPIRLAAPALGGALLTAAALGLQIVAA